jgi:integrase
MASIKLRGEYQWRALVRKKGFPSYSRTFEAHKDAVGWGRDLEAAIGRRDLVEVRRLTASGEDLGGSVGALVDRYIKDVLHSRKQQVSELARLLRIKAVFGRLALPMLTPVDVSRWRDARLAEGAAAGTVRHDLNSLSTVLRHAVSEWGVQVQNVVRDVKKPTEAAGRDRRVSELEIEFLLKAARTAPPGRPHETPARGLAPLIILAVETSMRLGELVQMRWPDVHLKERGVFLRETKNGDSRTVALSTTAIAVLRKLQKVQRLDGKVFDWIASDSVSHPFRRCVVRAQALYVADCKAAGRRAQPEFLADIRLHDLRHEACSRLFEKGLNSMEVASMTGHKSMQMLRRYTHVEATKVAAKLG